SGCIRRGERDVRRQRATELVRAGVVRRPVEDGTVAIDAADQHVDLRDDVRGLTVERRLEGRLDVAIRVEDELRLWYRRANRAPVVDDFTRAGAARKGEAVHAAHVERHVDAVEHARVV